MQTAAQGKSIKDTWRGFFARWPRGFGRKGVVMASFGEPVAFADFVMNQDFVVLERQAPDTHGARRVALPFECIEAVKFTEPLKTEQFLSNGFIGVQNEAQPQATSKAAPANPPVAAS